MGNKRCEGDVIRQGQEQYVLHRYGGMTEGAPRIKHLEPQKKAEDIMEYGLGYAKGFVDGRKYEKEKSEPQKKAEVCKHGSYKKYIGGKYECIGCGIELEQVWTEAKDWLHGNDHYELKPKKAECKHEGIIRGTNQCADCGEPQKKTEVGCPIDIGRGPCKFYPVEPQQEDMGKLNDMLDEFYKKDKIKPLKFIENGMTDYVYYEKINEIVKWINERD